MREIWLMSTSLGVGGTGPGRSCEVVGHLEEGGDRAPVASGAADILAAAQIGGQLALAHAAGEQEVEVAADGDHLLGRVPLEVRERHRRVGGADPEDDVEVPGVLT